MPNKKRMDAISKAMEILADNSPEIVRHLRKLNIIPKGL